MTRQVYEVKFYTQKPSRDWMAKLFPDMPPESIPDIRDRPHVDMIEADSEEALRRDMAADYEKRFEVWAKQPSEKHPERYALEILSITPRPDIPLYRPTNLAKMIKDENWEEAGHVDVDAGLIMVGDPCYASFDPERREDGTDPRKRHLIHNWSKFCDLLGGETYHATVPHLNHKGEASHAGAGVVVHSGCGDGTYPVYIRKAVIPGWGLRVVELRVLFDYESGEEGEEG